MYEMTRQIEIDTANLLEINLYDGIMKEKLIRCFGTSVYTELWNQFGGQIEFHLGQQLLENMKNG